MVLGRTSRAPYSMKLNLDVVFKFGRPTTPKWGQPLVTTEAACVATGSGAKVHNHSSFLSITSLHKSDEQGNNLAEA